MSLVMVGLVWAAAVQPPSCSQTERWTLVAHGGAGAWQLPPQKRERAQDVLRTSLAVGASMLREGATGIDVVEAVITRLEDAPELNAGRGGIPNREGYVELDAAIMQGSDLDAGAVAGLRVVKNPIRLARAVMQRSPHVLFVDRGAVAFAEKMGLTIVDPAYFLVRAPSAKVSKEKSGTVGAVVLDRCGHVTAGTSTGGYDAKIPGRVGDVPVIGAGTYANDRTAALSATGYGEFFIRYTAAHDVSALMEYKGVSLAEAMRRVLEDKIKPAGATGGLIGVTRDGTWATQHTSAGMLRGHVDQDRSPRVTIFGRLR